MSKIKKWLYNKFLPAWCKDDLLANNASLVKKVGDQKIEIERLKAYINGIETAMRYQRRVTVRNEVMRN